VNRYRLYASWRVPVGEGDIKAIETCTKEGGAKVITGAVRLLLDETVPDVITIEKVGA